MHEETFDNGTIIHYNDNHQMHRDGAPAVEYTDGGTVWYKNGELHNDDGPSVKYADGGKEWHLNGKELTEKQFNKIKNKKELRGKVTRKRCEKKYKDSDKHKETQKKYRASDKYKETRKKYRTEYRKSAKNKEYMKKYRATDKYKEYMKAYYKRKKLEKQKESVAILNSIGVKENLPEEFFNLLEKCVHPLE